MIFFLQPTIFPFSNFILNLKKIEKHEKLFLHLTLSVSQMKFVFHTENRQIQIQHDMSLICKGFPNQQFTNRSYKYPIYFVLAPKLFCHVKVSEQMASGTFESSFFLFSFSKFNRIPVNHENIVDNWYGKSRSSRWNFLSSLKKFFW
jgi:hypothetical protein